MASPEPLQRFSEVPDQLGMAILSVTPENPLLWTFLMENFNLGNGKISVTSENPLFPNPVLPKISVFSLTQKSTFVRWMMYNLCKHPHNPLVTTCFSPPLSLFPPELGLGRESNKIKRRLFSFFVNFPPEKRGKKSFLFFWRFPGTRRRKNRMMLKTVRIKNALRFLI